MVFRPASILLAAFAMTAGCDETPAAPAPAAVAAPSTQPSAPSTQPAKVRVPAFAADGLYGTAPGPVLRIAARGGREHVTLLLNSYERELARQYPLSKDLVVQLLKMYGEGVKPGQPYNGAAVLITGDEANREAALFFLASRSYVHVDPSFQAMVDKARGQAVVLDPPVRVSYFVHRVSEYADEDGGPPELSEMMTAGGISLALRSNANGGAGDPRAVPFAVIEDDNKVFVMDKIPGATTRPSH